MRETEQTRRANRSNLKKKTQTLTFEKLALASSVASFEQKEPERGGARERGGRELADRSRNEQQKIRSRNETVCVCVLCVSSVWSV